METVLLVIHIIIAFALIGLILLQRSEGGALGVGGSANLGAVAPRAQADGLTKTTAWLAGIFIVTSLLLVILAQSGGHKSSLVDQLSAGAPVAAEPVQQKPVTPQTAPLTPVTPEPAAPAVPLAN